MRAADVEAGLSLCRLAGWNQLRPDWQRLLEQEPVGCFVATLEQAVIGTVTTTCYGTALAWIGMMLVHPEYRRKGVARQLLQHSLAYLASRQIKCIRLDATPAGAKVYTQLGFEPEWSFQRWSGRGAGGDGEVSWRHSTAELMPELLAMDRQAFGADRAQMLQKLADDSLLLSCPDGYGMLRRGHLANYLGPVVARQAASAAELIGELCRTADGTIFWDIPAGNSAACGLAAELGFAPVRQLTRMRVGEATALPQLWMQYGLADPSKG